jgi:ABC-type multidrug transport system ATPase subunit
VRSPEPLLALEHVSAGYGGDPVVRDVSLEVRGGEVVGLVGPNGSGKTTLVRVASRALRPERGAVRVAGRDRTRPPDARRRGGSPSSRRTSRRPSRSPCSRRC